MGINSAFIVLIVLLQNSLMYSTSGKSLSLIPDVSVL